jgi:hypothetical protein
MARRGLWPTPQASDHRIGMPERYRGSMSILNDAAARYWRTPKASDSAHPGRTAWKPGQTLSLDMQVNREETGPGGKLNPTWVEWLMGFPLEWTASEP